MPHCPTWSGRHRWIIPSPFLDSVRSAALLIAGAIHIVVPRLPAICAIPLICISSTYKVPAVTKAIAVTKTIAVSKAIAVSWYICTTSSCVASTRCIWKSPGYARSSRLASGWSSTSWTLQAPPLHQLNHKNAKKVHICYSYTIAG